ncbi:MAG: VanZ family protein [Candidatus Rokubacteria bacterium]|nr:VanZ family protein [Candidatus Rokubacteria bacterium]
MGVIAGGICAFGILLVTTAGAVPVRETPAELLKHRGMPLAFATIALGVVALLAVPVRREPERHLVSSDTLRRRWMAVALWVGLIYLTLPIGFQVVSAIVKTIGHSTFRRAVNALGALVALGCVGALLWRRTPLRAYVVFAGLVLVYTYYFAALEVTVKRIHFLEYSFLSVLAERALRPFTPPPHLYLWVVLLALWVGTVEEWIAVFLPRRYGALSDVVFDVAAGTLGALFVKFVLRAG